MALQRMSVCVRSLVDLPDNCLVDILRNCSPVDVLRLQLVCTRLLALGRLPNVWVSHILTDAGFRAPREHHNYGHLTKIYRGLVCPQAPDGRLIFSGVVTDGGCQDGMKSYWVDNLFNHDIQGMYCSEVVSRDIRCVALHTKTIADALDYSTPSTLGNTEADIQASGSLGSGRRKPRELSYDEDLIQTMQRAPLPGADKSELVVTRKLIVGRMGIVTCPVSCGVIFAGEFNPPQVQISSELAQELYKGMQSPVVDYLSGIYDVESLLFSCKEGTLAKPKAVVWHKAGEWVEFDQRSDDGGCLGLRPVVWFRFYKRDEFVSRKSHRAKARRAYLTKEFASIGVVCKRNTAKPINAIRINASWYELFHHHLAQLNAHPDVLTAAAFYPMDAQNAMDVDDETEEEEEDGEEDDEDNGQLDHLQNLMQWMDFSSSNFNQSYASRRSMAGRDYMEITLQQPMVGNMVGVCLNAAENLMNEYQEEARPEPNIDANIVWMVGNTIPLE